MVEYDPLISKRIHKLKSDEKGILMLSQENNLRIIYYIQKKNQLILLLIIRILILSIMIRKSTRSNKVFTSIQLPLNDGYSEQQYYYILSIFFFYQRYPNSQEARKICEKYLNYPIIYWRNLFYEIANSLSEFNGDEDQKRLSIKQQTLSCEIQGSKIQITYSNLQHVIINQFKLLFLDLINTIAIMLLQFTLKIHFPLTHSFQIGKETFQLQNLIKFKIRRKKKFINKKQIFYKTSEKIISIYKQMIQIRNVSQIISQID